MSLNQNLAPNKLLNLDYLNSESIYLHDNLFFSKIEANEAWTFQSNPEISTTGLAFLFARSLISDAIFENKISVLDITPSIKAKIAKLGHSESFNAFLKTSPILGVANKKEIPETIQTLFLDNKYFHLEEFDKKSTVLAGGGVLKEKRTNANEMVEKLFSEFSLRDKTGHFFLRTKTNSYLYLLNPENKSKTFYIQQKNSFPVDFQFYHIKIYQ